MKRILQIVVIVGCGVLGFGLQAHALSITPNFGVFGETRWTGNQTGQNQIDEAISVYLQGATEVYKQNVGGAESGSLAGSYNTAFFATPSDPSGATISYNIGSPIIGDPKFLLVKDGNHSPGWYLFRLIAWNGTEELVLSGFWPDQGAISHVTLYGGKTQVPEPTTLLLLGLGLVGLAGAGRKMKK